MGQVDRRHGARHYPLLIAASAPVRLEPGCNMPTIGAQCGDIGRSCAVNKPSTGRSGEELLHIRGVSTQVTPAQCGGSDGLAAGAWLVQVYTGLVYTGPSLIRDINRGLLRACEEAGAAHLSALRNPLPL